MLLDVLALGQSIIILGKLLFKRLLMGWRHDKAAEIKASHAGC
jgi:hypothetical protein